MENQANYSMTENKLSLLQRGPVTKGGFQDGPLQHKNTNKTLKIES